jgi:hypothetical protein
MESALFGTGDRALGLTIKKHERIPTEGDYENADSWTNES